MEFANGEEIYVATSYSKADSENNITPLEEAVALQEAANLKAQQDAYKMNMALGIAPAADYSDYTQDSYMRVDYAVTYQGDGNHLYVVDGEWLTMPFFRGFDSIGSCAMNGTVTNSTRSGSYEYDITYINMGSISYDDYSGTITNKKNAVNGNWYGSAGVINLPNDVYGEYSSVNIGEKKLRQIVADNINSGFVIQNGVKILIKRRRFEDYLEEMTAL